MAKYIRVQNLGMYTYALDECEDYIVLDAYLQIIESGRFAAAKHIKVFERYHLEDGGTLNDNILLQINSSLRQFGRPPLIFVNGHTTNYAWIRGQDKKVLREKILDHLRSLDPKARADLVARKESDASRLPERDANFSSRASATSDNLSHAERTPPGRVCCRKKSRSYTNHIRKR